MKCRTGPHQTGTGVAKPRLALPSRHVRFLLLWDIR